MKRSVSASRLNTIHRNAKRIRDMTSNTLMSEIQAREAYIDDMLRSRRDILHMPHPHYALEHVQEERQQRLQHPLKSYRLAELLDRLEDSEDADKSKARQELQALFAGLGIAEATELIASKEVADSIKMDLLREMPDHRLLTIATRELQFKARSITRALLERTYASPSWTFIDAFAKRSPNHIRPLELPLPEAVFRFLGRADFEALLRRADILPELTEDFTFDDPTPTQRRLFALYVSKLQATPTRVLSKIARALQRQKDSIKALPDVSQRWDDPTQSWAEFSIDRMMHVFWTALFVSKTPQHQRLHARLRADKSYDCAWVDYFFSIGGQNGLISRALRI